MQIPPGISDSFIPNTQGLHSITLEAVPHIGKSLSETTSCLKLVLVHLLYSLHGCPLVGPWSGPTADTQGDVSQTAVHHLVICTFKLIKVGI